MYQTQAEKDIILKTLNEKREAMYKELKHMDNVIKNVKATPVATDVTQNNTNSHNLNGFDDYSKTVTTNAYPLKADTKIQILSILDMINKACKLKDIQLKFNELNNTKNVNIRESIRTLNKAGKILMMKEKDATRGNYWVKSEWVANGVLQQQYKFDGFDLYYNDDNLLFLQAGREQDDED